MARATRKKSKTGKAKPKTRSKDKKKVEGKKQKMEVLNGKTGKVIAYEKNGDKRVKIVDHSAGSEWHMGTTARLEELKEQIKRQCRTMGEGVHGIGLCLKLVRDDKLWRVDRAGSFGDWIENHTDMSRPTAYNCIAVATHLTRKQAGKFGPTLSYSIAKATDSAAAKELRTLAQSGASAKEMENERLRALRERDQDGLPPRKRARGPRKVKRAVSVHNSRGDDIIEVDEKEIEKSAGERKRDAAGVTRGETGIHEIKPIVVTKTDKKAGWDLAVPKMQVGKDGPVIKLWINVKEMRVRYRIL